MQNFSTNELNLNLIKLIQKYFEVINDSLNNPNLFKLDIPGVETLFDVSSKVWADIFNNPFNLMRCNLDYQLKVIGYALTIKNQDELIKLLHNELFIYYENFIDSSQINKKDKEYLLFFLKQFLHAISPDNFVFFNNKILNSSIESNCQNLINGLDNLQRDLKNSTHFFDIPNVNKFSFEVGENLATTEGKVVYRNELMELICYKPLKQTFSAPILIVPPCINRYYVLDLSESNSFVRWLVNNNFQVFLISWVNPKSFQQNFEFEEYIKLGVLDASKYIRENFGYKKINLLGYCIGGTIAAISVAYCAKNSANIFNSVTFLNTMLDFDDPGEIAIFIRNDIVKQLQKISEAKGYLDGLYLYNIFNLLKSKELIWSAYINNYLEDNQPKAFDILYWNSDYVNLSAKMFDFYLSNMYLNNLLAKPNEITILDTKIDLSQIKIPSFFVASKSDHIVPWKQSYKSMMLLKGERKFCLAAAGHVVGIINPPSSNKYAYWQGDIKDNSEEWLNSSQKYDGSWWLSYLPWLQNHSNKMKASMDYDNIKSETPAPGKFCKK